MKHALTVTMAAFLLSACATGGQSCINSSNALSTAVDFGSDEAAEAYAALPKLDFDTDLNAQALPTIKQVTDALSIYDMSAEGETAFLRRRLAANQRLGNKTAATTDVERLIALDNLSPNEGPYLRRTVETTKAPSLKPKYDRDAKPLVRLPPIMSKAALYGNKSGHCQLDFDVSSTGTVENIRVGYCTNENFRESSISSLARWKYNPALQDGKTVVREGLKTTIAYRIQDVCGNTYPL